MSRYLWCWGLLALLLACEDESTGETDDGATAQEELPSVWIGADAGLPTGESSVDSLAITVSGNDSATAYQYALFSDTSITCADATYGSFQDIGTELSESSLGANGPKVLCLRGKDKDDKVQAEPQRYLWTKVKAEGVGLTETKPEALLVSPPQAKDSRAKIESKVEGSDVTTHYQHALIPSNKLSNGDYDCANVETDNIVKYTPKVAIGRTLMLVLATDGQRVLCLRGLDKDGNKQSTATKYRWVKVTPAPNPQNEKPAAGKAGIGLENASINFSSGDRSAVSVTVKNVGEGTLQWRAETTTVASWLQVRTSMNGAFKALTAGELTTGTTLKGDNNVLITFKLAKGRGTDYGRPYERTQRIDFINTESNYKMTATIALKIPKLDIKRADVALARESATVKVLANDITNTNGSEALKIAVVPAFPADLKHKKQKYQDFQRRVTVSTGGDSSQRYVEFRVKSKNNWDCKHVKQTIMVYSNGDSKGTSNCNIVAGKNYIGGKNSASWTTRRCKRIYVKLNNFDLNDDGKVNILDLTAVAGKVGDPPDPMTADYRRADVDGNGKVDKADLEALGACFDKPKAS